MYAYNMFESRVVLDSSKTKPMALRHFQLFESRVVLDSSKTH